MDGVWISTWRLTQCGGDRNNLVKTDFSGTPFCRELISLILLDTRCLYFWSLGSESHWEGEVVPQSHFNCQERRRAVWVQTCAWCCSEQLSSQRREVLAGCAELSWPMQNSFSYCTPSAFLKTCETTGISLKSSRETRKNEVLNFLWV